VSPAGQPELLVDTSAAIALLVEDHEGHAAVVVAARHLRLGLAGHAAFETYSVLTRLPPPARVGAVTARRLLSTNFPATRFLGAPAAERTLDTIAATGITGGAVYDALVGAVAAAHQVDLLTRDRRALDTYRAVGAEARLVPG